MRKLSPALGASRPEQLFAPRGPLPHRGTGRVFRPGHAGLPAVEGRERRGLRRYARPGEKWDTAAEYISLYPNVLLGVHRDHSFAIILEPVEHDADRRACRNLLSWRQCRGPDFAALRARNTAQWKVVFEEDIFVVEGMQQGRNAVAFRRRAFLAGHGQPDAHVPPLGRDTIVAMTVSAARPVSLHALNAALLAAHEAGDGPRSPPLRRGRRTSRARATSTPPASSIPRPMFSRLKRARPTPRLTPRFFAPTAGCENLPPRLAAHSIWVRTALTSRRTA